MAQEAHRNTLEGRAFSSDAKEKIMLLKKLILASALILGCSVSTACQAVTVSTGDTMKIELSNLNSNTNYVALTLAFDIYPDQVDVGESFTYDFFRDSTHWDETGNSLGSVTAFVFTSSALFDSTAYLIFYNIVGTFDVSNVRFAATILEPPFDSVVLDGVVTVTDAVVPIPAALPLFAAGLSAMGFMGWRRKRKAVA